VQLIQLIGNKLLVGLITEVLILHLQHMKLVM